MNNTIISPSTNYTIVNTCNSLLAKELVETYPDKINIESWNCYYHYWLLKLSDGTVGIIAIEGFDDLFTKERVITSIKIQ